MTVTLIIADRRKKAVINRCLYNDPITGFCESLDHRRDRRDNPGGEQDFPAINPELVMLTKPAGHRLKIRIRDFGITEHAMLCSLD